MADRQPSVLVIDDDRSLLLGLQAIMKRAGYQVLIASSGSEGLSLAEERCPDVIVCDVMMPPPNGLEVRRTLSRNPQMASIPFIFLTARVSQADKVHGIDLGADDYITKPFDREELLARIRAVLRREEIGREQGRLEAEAQLQQLRRVAGNVVVRALNVPAGNAVATVDSVLESKFGSDADGQQAFVKHALQDETNLNLLIDDLVILDALDQGDLQVARGPVDLQKEFSDIIDQCLQRWQSKDLSLDVEINDGVEITAPTNLFGRVAVRHLVDNACKFSPRKGKISIRLSGNGHGGCSLMVSDQGPGIPVDYRERVFERYFQLEPDGETGDVRGLGIGLTAVRALARALGGDAVIEETSAGCTVLMTLPPDTNVKD
jgi:two-component system sensor histidine kinase/response regulator